MTMSFWRTMPNLKKSWCMPGRMYSVPGHTCEGPGCTWGQGGGGGMEAYNKSVARPHLARGLR